MLRDLRRYTGSSPREGRFGMGVVREDLPALILWLLEGDGSKDLPYPFSLTHFEFQQRCQQALQRAQGWVPTSRTLPERRAIEHLASLVGRSTRIVVLPPRSLGWREGGRPSVSYAMSCN